MANSSFRRRIARRIALAATIVAAFLAGAVPVSAQRAVRPRAGHARQSPQSATVRAELAGVLLHAGRFDEAAREYRVLLSRSPRSAEYRLGLARALAWGNHYREAEAELRRYRAEHGTTPVVESLLRSVRDAYEPRPSEAAAWVRERPDYAPYRLALARALARQGDAFLAGAQYDTLMRSAGIAPVPPAPALLREKADAFVAAHAPAMGASVLARALALSPADTALRHGLAQLLIASDQSAAAIAQYDTLLSLAPTAGLYRERAEVRLARHEPALAERDLRSSVALSPTAGAFLVLGDLRRDAGDYAAARDAYAAAAALPGLSPDDARALAAGRGQLAREERPAALVPTVGQDAGWSLSSDFAADNQGVHYATTRVRRGVALGHGFSAGAAVDVRTFGGSGPGSAAGASRATPVGYTSNGAGARGAIAWEATYGQLLLRAMGRLGVVTQQGAGAPMRDVGASALLAAGTWQGAIEVADAPAYPSLFTVASVAMPGEAALTERDVTATLAGPAGPVDAAASWQRSALSDGNERSSGELYARLPIEGPLAAVYQGSVIAFAQRSDRYWDPLHYVAHAAGAELAWRRSHGLSLAVRVLPEYARSRELVAPAAVVDTAADGSITVVPQPRSELVTRAALQLGASAELGWRADGWEIAAALAHGRGRAGAYQRTAGTITVRLLP